jgi:hypothetical protein
MTHTNAEQYATTQYQLQYPSSSLALSYISAPRPLMFGAPNNNILCRVVKGVVKAKKSPLTIRALVSLVWSRWSRWSRQNPTYRTCARAHARVYRQFVLISDFNLFKNALTTLTTIINSYTYALTTALTNFDHLDHANQKGF